MAINFPDSPTLNQEFTSAGRTWKWDGTTWVSVGSLTVADITDLTATATEINYTDGVTSAIQTQLDSKASFPSQTGNAGELLVTDGTNASWSNTVTANSISTSALIAKGLSGQTASLQRWTNSSNTTLTSIEATGELLVPKIALDQTADQIGLRVRAVSGQTNSLQQWQDPSGTALASIGPTGLLTATPAAGTSTTAATGVGYMGIPASGAGASGAYTLVEADAGELVYTTTSRTVTIPANASVPFQIGTTIVFVSGTGATTTIAINSDTLTLAGTGTTGSRTLAAHGMATAVKVASTTWYISGNGLS